MIAKEKSKRGRKKGGRNSAKLPSVVPQATGLATVAEAMAYLRVSKGTVHKLITGESPTITPVRMGRAVRINWALLREFAGDAPKTPVPAPGQ